MRKDGWLGAIFRRVKRQLTQILLSIVLVVTQRENRIKCKHVYWSNPIGMLKMRSSLTLCLIRLKKARAETVLIDPSQIKSEKERSQVIAGSDLMQR